MGPNHVDGKGNVGNRGGLGDQLAGLLTTAAYALVTDRRVVVPSTSGLAAAFEVPVVTHDPTEQLPALECRCISAGSCKLASLGCPALLRDWPNETVRVYAGRAQLCSWVLPAATGAGVEAAGERGGGGAAAWGHRLRRWGIHRESLATAAGCMLRAVLGRPRAAVSERLAAALPPELPPVEGDSDSEQGPYGHVGIHLRTGEADMAARERRLSFNPATRNTTWGTAGAPELRRCADRLAKGGGSGGGRGRDGGGRGGDRSGDRGGVGPTALAAYVTSDSSAEREQLARALLSGGGETGSRGSGGGTSGGATSLWRRVVVAEGAPMHTASKKCSTACFVNTSAEWLGLALSRTVVVQGAVVVPGARHSAGVGLPVRERGGGASASSAEGSEGACETVPASAFSRYAALYSLEPPVMAAPGCPAHGGCTTAHRDTWTRTHKSWVCE